MYQFNAEFKRTTAKYAHGSTALLTELSAISDKLLFIFFIFSQSTSVPRSLHSWSYYSVNCRVLRKLP